jgi:fimbrial chaperone protein
MVSFILTAQAYELTPLERTVSPAGRNAVTTFRLENKDSKPVAVELSMFSRTMTDDGSDILTPAENDFVVYPQQAIVMPGEAQTIKVSFVGTPPSGVEAAYRLVADQLPVDMDKKQADKGGAMAVLVRYVASLYVQPDGVKPSVVVKAAELTAGGRLRLVLENSGTSHALLNDIQLRVGDKVLEGPQLEGLLGQNLLAGVKREFFIVAPDGTAKVPDVKLMKKQ